MLSKYSVKKPMTVLVAVVLIIGLGFLSFSKLKTDLLPSMELPFIVVATTYPGATPEKIEETVTKPLETGLSTVPGIENISSSSSENQSIIFLEFGYETNMDSALIEVNSQLDLLEGFLDDAVIPPMVIKMNPDMMPIMIMGVSQDGKDVTELSKEIENNIIPQLERIQGVGAVNSTGLVSEQLQITLDKEKVDEINAQLLGSVSSSLEGITKQIELGEAELAKLNAELEKNISEQIGDFTTQQKELIDSITEIETTLIPLINAQAQLNTELNAATKQRDELQAIIDSIEAGGGTPSADQVNSLALLNSNVFTLTAQVEAIDSQIAPLKATKTGLEKTLIDISGGADLINSAYINLRAEIAIQESLLQNQKAQLESEKSDALEAANIEELLTAEMISNILMAQNFSLPAGYVSEGDTEFALKIGEQFTSLEEIENLVIMDTGTMQVELGDIASISVQETREDVYSKVNGKDAIILSIQKQSNISTAEASENINNQMQEMIMENEGLGLTPLMDQGVYIDIIIGSVLNNLILGGIFAILILYLFLRNVRPTIVVSLSIPISIMFAIVLMYFSGVDLNIISLSGLALGVGMLLDNSIVVIENIFRMRSQGMSSLKAAVAGAKEISGAIVASTLTTICVFMPILFTDGMSRQLFMDMGLTIAYSLIASLVVALTVVPSLSATLLKKELKQPGKLFEKSLAVYEKLLKKTLERRALVLITAVLLLVASAGIAANTGIVFIPEADSDEMSATFVVDEETTVDEARELGDDIVEEMLQIEGIEIVGVQQGSMMGQGKDISAYIKLDEDRDKSSQEIGMMISEIAMDYPVEAQVTTSTMDMSALSGTGIQVKILGTDLDTLIKISNEIKEISLEIEGVETATNGQEEAAVEKRIIVDKNKASEYNLTVAQVYQEISKALETEVDSTTVTLDAKDYQVVVIKDNEDFLTYDKLENHIISMDGATGNSEVELGEIAKFEEAEGLATISHEDLTRVMTVTVTPEEGENVTLVGRDLENALEGYELPDGYEIDYGGEMETIMETMYDLIVLILVAIAFVYLIMVAQFQTLLSPFIIMFTMPLAFTGGFLALVITGHELSVIAMLGFVMLSGIVVNNGIVFVDYTNKLRAEGMEKREALITAGTRRFRPIVMTALTTVLGLMTLALGIGTGTEMISPMAIVVIGGLLYATLMTLFVVPVMYDLLYRKEFKIIRDEDLEEIKELDKI